VAKFEVLAVFGREILSTVWFLGSHNESGEIDEIVVDGSYSCLLVVIESFAFLALVVSVSISEHWCFDVAWDWREDG